MEYFSLLYDYILYDYIIKIIIKHNNLSSHHQKNIDDAFDITQDVFLRAFQNLGTLQDCTKLSAWLCGITFNLCNNWLIKYRYASLIDEMNDNTQDLLLYSHISSPEQEYEDKENHDMLEKAINAISQNYRLLIKLYYMDEMSYKEIATFLNVSVSTVGTRIFRARKQL